MTPQWSQIFLTLVGPGLLALGLAPTAALAQSDAGSDAEEAAATGRVAERPLATRSELESRVEELQERIRSRKEVEEARDLEGRIEKIRLRLREGDFRQGDRVRLSVPADPSLSGTFSVNRFRELELPGSFANPDLTGVLYSEIDSVARSVVSEYVRNPRVRARVLWPISITGAVANPGYYNLPPGTTLSEAVMEAGGFTSDARLEDIAFRRGDRNLLRSQNDDKERPPVEVMTLADLNARAGDELRVPGRGGGGFGAREILGLVSAVSGTVWGLTRIF